MCGASKRVTANNFIYYIYILGELVVVVFAYFIRDYKYLYACYTCLMTAFIFYFWYVPESPRWLMAKHKNNEAYRIFKRIAQSNRREDLNELESIKTNNRLDTFDLKVIKSTNTTSTNVYDVQLTDQYELNKSTTSNVASPSENNKAVISHILSFLISHK